jgi:hypothetical protein
MDSAGMNPPSRKALDAADPKLGGPAKHREIYVIDRHH